MGNPLLSKWGRIVGCGICLVLIPASYLASYPIAFRALVGSDANRAISVPASQVHCGYCAPSVSPSALALKKYRVWEWLQRYYFPPAEWLIDHTPVRHPILTIAGWATVDEQIKSHIRGRDFGRRLNAVLATRNKQAIADFMDRELVLDNELTIRSESSPTGDPETASASPGETGL